MRRKEKEITDINEIEKVMLKSDVCRIAMAAGNIPYIVTMNFGYENNSGMKLYFHCAKYGKKLEMISKNNLVCFEMDTDHVFSQGINACESSISYLSVVGYGYISVVDDENEKRKGIDCIMKHYTGTEAFEYKNDSFDRMLVLRLDITGLTGKRG